MEPIALAERAHDLAHLRLDEREEHDGAATACALGGEVHVLDGGDARMAHDLELLARKLRLDGLDHPGGGLARRVGDHVQLDGLRHRHLGI